VKFGSAVIGRGGVQIEILDEHHTIVGLHLKPEIFKTRVTKLGDLYVLHVITNIPPILNSND
jgi:hypothetical protein